MCWKTMEPSISLLAFLEKGIYAFYIEREELYSD